MPLFKFGKKNTNTLCVNPISKCCENRLPGIEKNEYPDKTSYYLKWQALRNWFIHVEYLVLPHVQY